MVRSRERADGEIIYSVRFTGAKLGLVARRGVARLLRGNQVLRSSSDIVLRHDTAYRTAMSWSDRTIFRLATLLP